MCFGFVLILRLYEFVCVTQPFEAPTKGPNETFVHVSGVSDDSGRDAADKTGPELKANICASHSLSLTHARPRSPTRGSRPLSRHLFLRLTLADILSPSYVFFYLNSLIPCSSLLGTPPPVLGRSVESV